MSSVKGLRVLRYLLFLAFEMLLIPPLLLLSLAGRVSRKKFDVGIGPEPIISHRYHKNALEKFGYSVQTFVTHVFYITDSFDVRADLLFQGSWYFLRGVYLFLLCVLRYRCIFIYFNGGPLGFTRLLWRIEPSCYKLSGTRVVVMPYGGDVQEMTRSPNLLFKHVMSRDYPAHRLRRKNIQERIDLWTRRADHVIGGCEWVDYLYHWDTLMLSHFAIDTEVWGPGVHSGRQGVSADDGTIRILHAPNHRNIKGTRHFVRAVQELKDEGHAVELIIKERVSNEDIKKAMSDADIIADQLVIGWYAMFAMEAMAMGKPVLCYIREDLENLYVQSGLLVPEELPIVRCAPRTVKEVLKDLISDRRRLSEIGRQSREYIIRHHSLGQIGSVLRDINESIGVFPTGSPVITERRHNP